MPAHRVRWERSLRCVWEVVPDVAALHNQVPVCDIHAGDLDQHDLIILLPAQDCADWSTDVRWRQRAVATWYSSGWNTWWFRRSMTVNSTGALASAFAAATPAKPLPTMHTLGIG